MRTLFIRNVIAANNVEPANERTPLPGPLPLDGEREYPSRRLQQCESFSMVGRALTMHFIVNAPTDCIFSCAAAVRTF